MVGRAGGSVQTENCAAGLPLDLGRWLVLGGVWEWAVGGSAQAQKCAAGGPLACGSVAGWDGYWGWAKGGSVQPEVCDTIKGGKGRQRSTLAILPARHATR